MSVLDAAYPQWRQDAPREYIRHWMTDEFAESRFYVWPPAEAKVDVVVDTTETGITVDPSSIVFPTLPVEPVDPGAVGNGQTPYTLYNGFIGQVSGFNNSMLVLEHADDTVETDDFDVFNTATRNVVYLDSIAAEAIYRMSHCPQHIFAKGNGVVTFAYPVWSLRVSDVELFGNDQRFAAGQYLLITPQGGNIYNVDDFNYDYDPIGTTQEDVDQYQIDLAAYNKAVADYQSFLDESGISPPPEPFTLDDPGELVEGVEAATWDANSAGTAGGTTFQLSDGDTVFTHLSGNNYANVGVTESAIHDSGKYYFEFENPTDNNFCLYGFYTDVDAGSPLNILYLGSTSTSYGYQTTNGRNYNNNSFSIVGGAIAAGTRIFNRVDFDTGVWEFSTDGSTWTQLASDIPPNAIVGVSVTASADAQIFADAASFEGTIPDGYEPLSVSVAGVSQADIDAYESALTTYNQLLEIYNLQVSSYAAALTASSTEAALQSQLDSILNPSVDSAVSPGHTIRGTFTKTPRIDVLEAPTVPDEPVAPVAPVKSTTTLVEPVDPGEIGDGGTALTTYRGVGYYFASVGRDQLVLEHLDDSGRSDLTAGEFIVRLDSVPQGLASSNEKRTLNNNPSEVFAFGTGDTSANDYGYTVRSLRDDTNTSLVSPDARLVVGNYLRITETNSIWTIQDFDFDYSEGTTQDDIDAYAVELAAYNADLDVEQAEYDAMVAEYDAMVAEYDALVAERDAAIAILDAFNARDVLRRSDELPLDDMHIPSLEEFALYYCYAVDDDVTANSGRAQRHWLAFFQLINKAEDATLMIKQAQDKTE